MLYKLHISLLIIIFETDIFLDNGEFLINSLIKVFNVKNVK